MGAIQVIEKLEQDKARLEAEVVKLKNRIVGYSGCQERTEKAEAEVEWVNKQKDILEKALKGLRHDYELNNNRANKAEAKLLTVANNIAGSPATIVEWSVKVGEALSELDRLQQGNFEADNTKLREALGWITNDEKLEKVKAVVDLLEIYLAEKNVLNLAGYKQELKQAMQALKEEIE